MSSWPCSTFCRCRRSTEAMWSRGCCRRGSRGAFANWPLFVGRPGRPAAGAPRDWRGCVGPTVSPLVKHIASGMLGIFGIRRLNAPRLDHPRQAGRPGLDPGGQRGQAHSARGRRAQDQGRPRRHARSAGERRAARSRWRSDQARGRMLDATKAYDFTIRFGEETDTLDAEGKVVATSEVRPTLAAVEAVPDALHRRDRAGSAGLFGAEDRRQSAYAARAAGEASS